MEGLLGGIIFVPAVKSIVDARWAFFVHITLISDLRCCALSDITRKRFRQQLSSLMIMSLTTIWCGDCVMAWTKSLNTGSTCGTTGDWHSPVPRMADHESQSRRNISVQKRFLLEKTWNIQAYRSALIIDGKTSATRTKAPNEAVIRVIASSDICWRADHELVSTTHGTSGRAEQHTQ